MDTAITAAAAGLPATAHFPSEPDKVRSFFDFLDAAPTTERNYTKALKRFFSWLTDKGIRNPDEGSIRAYKKDLIQTVKPGSVHLYLTALRLFFRWTFDQRLYPNIADHIKAPRTGRSHSRDSLTPGQAHLVLDTAKAHERDGLSGLKLYAIALLMLTGGPRCIEVSRANIADIRQADGHRVLYVQGKGHAEADRPINLTEEADAAIRAYLTARRAKPDEPLFTSDSNNNRGSRMTSDAVSRAIKGLFRECGIDSPRLTAHSTRHTAATIASQSGNAIEDVSCFLGHADLSTTMIYDHAVSRTTSRCEQSVQNAIFSARY